MERLQRFDAHPDVLVCITHDPVLLKVLPSLNDQPGEYLNDCQAAGLKEQAQWECLGELPRGGRPGHELYVQGVWKEDLLVEDFTRLNATIH